MNLPSGLSEEEIEVKLREMGGAKRKRQCVDDKLKRAQILELFMTHLQFHPLIYHPIEGEFIQTEEELKANWMSQVEDMEKKCREDGESWAWEYLWKHWYRPDRWKLWARCVWNELPITHSNTYVEALWSSFKERYLRHYRRPRMELMVDIFMSQYIPKKVHLTRLHRERRVAPDW